MDKQKKTVIYGCKEGSVILYKDGTMVVSRPVELSQEELKMLVYSYSTFFGVPEKKDF